MIDAEQAQDLAAALTRAIPTLSDAELDDDTDQTTATCHEWFTGATAKTHLQQIVAFLTSHSWVEVVMPTVIVMAD